MKMRCLVVREPWCSLIVSGAKTIEVRGTSIAAGPLVICGSASTDGPYSRRTACIVDVCDSVPFDAERHLNAAFLRGFTIPYRKPMTIILSGARFIKSNFIRGMPGIFWADVLE